MKKRRKKTPKEIAVLKLAKGAISPNELRILDGLPPFKGKDTILKGKPVPWNRRPSRKKPRRKS